MALNIPESLLHLEANCGVFSLWMLFQHHGIEMDVGEIARLCQHDPEQGTFTIALAVALDTLGFQVAFYTDEDPHIDASERKLYQEARTRDIAIEPAISYEAIQTAIEQGKMAIVSYDTLDGVGNQSLVYSIDDQEICFFDSFDPMPKLVFEHQRKADGICRQVILIDDRRVQLMHSAKLN
ncbi:cysteine peptidase family C39 domain-containing protein [Acinetobacter soli]|uniref:cysteine peptidase family C39 domain-containing protein n=1 Tax=Acinetobacter soli TaxID=487316 RepID=UPI000CE4FAE4|nr:cysteine peptidase family C39 domain-containing protein [Acinetobacter soli]PPB85479.1 peptidase C39 [Acinetobacter soli]WEI11927.1 cysteine peptidase family C39 domain-containing protein [Acinetobacter soli]WEI15954.1 cysteine peptidase family C39 domain-containing protein [Acinetobacter soli]